jgi:hypothetical protein
MQGTAMSSPPHAGLLSTRRAMDPIACPGAVHSVTRSGDKQSRGDQGSVERGHFLQTSGGSSKDSADDGTTALVLKIRSNCGVNCRVLRLLLELSMSLRIRPEICTSTYMGVERVLTSLCSSTGLLSCIVDTQTGFQQVQGAHDLGAAARNRPRLHVPCGPGFPGRSRTWQLTMARPVRLPPSCTTRWRWCSTRRASRSRSCLLRCCVAAGARRDLA